METNTCPQPQDQLAARGPPVWSCRSGGLRPGGAEGMWAEVFMGGHVSGGHSTATLCPHVLQAQAE